MGKNSTWPRIRAVEVGAGGGPGVVDRRRAAKADLPIHDPLLRLLRAQVDEAVQRGAVLCPSCPVLPPRVTRRGLAVCRATTQEGVVGAAAAAVVAGQVVATTARGAVVTRNSLARARPSALRSAMHRRMRQLRRCRVKSASIGVTHEIKQVGPPALPGALILTSFCNVRSRRRVN